MKPVGETSDVTNFQVLLSVTFAKPPPPKICFRFSELQRPFAMAPKMLYLTSLVYST